MTIGTNDLCEITRIVILNNVTLRKSFTILIHALPSGTHLSCDIRRMLALEQVNLDEYYRICCMARSLRSLRQVATLRNDHMARRSAPLRSCIQGTSGM